MADPREPSKIVRAEGEVRWCLAAWLEAVGSVDQARQIRYLWHWHADATPHTTGMMITHKQDFRLFGRVVCRDMSVCVWGGVILTALMLVQSGKSLYSIAQGARKLSEAVLPAIAAESLRSAGGTEAM